MPSARNNPPSRWRIVTNEHSQQFLNLGHKQFDILEENVTRAFLDLCYHCPNGQLPVIESITSNRAAQQYFDAVYILVPTSANFERFIRDFSGGWH